MRIRGSIFRSIILLGFFIFANSMQAAPVPDVGPSPRPTPPPRPCPECGPVAPQPCVGGQLCFEGRIVETVDGQISTTPLTGAAYLKRRHPSYPYYFLYTDTYYSMDSNGNFQISPKDSNESTLAAYEYLVIEAWEYEPVTIDLSEVDMDHPSVHLTEYIQLRRNKLKVYPPSQGNGVMPTVEPNLVVMPVGVVPTYNLDVNNARVQLDGVFEVLGVTVNTQRVTDSVSFNVKKNAPDWTTGLLKAEFDPPLPVGTVVRFTVTASILNGKGGKKENIGAYVGAYAVVGNSSSLATFTTYAEEKNTRCSLATGTPLGFICNY
jgi:hypothetical protein